VFTNSKINLEKLRPEYICLYHVIMISIMQSLMTIFSQNILKKFCIWEKG